LVPEEERDFHPHLTIGRIKQRIALEKVEMILKKFEDEMIDQMIVESFVLMQSQLQRIGPVYTPLKEFSLRKEE
jgi:2'-5' RNA ligase